MAAHCSKTDQSEFQSPSAPPRLEVTIEIPKGSFLKRGASDDLDFVSPLPCPFNYGSVPNLIGLEGDLLDAVVLGPRLPRGHQSEFYVFGAIGLTDRDMYDDKLICALQPPTARQRQFVVRFFDLYAWCKGWLNLIRGQRGRNANEGWGDAWSAIERAQPMDSRTWTGSRVKF